MKKYQDLADAVWVRHLSNGIAKIIGKVLFFIKKHIPTLIIMMFCITPVFA